MNYDLEPLMMNVPYHCSVCSEIRPSRLIVAGRVVHTSMQRHRHLHRNRCCGSSMPVVFSRSSWYL